MIGIDNKKYLLAEIEKFATESIKSLENRYKEELKSIKHEEDRKHARRIELLKEKHDKDLKKLENQMKSSFELSQRKVLLEKQGEVFNIVIEELKNSLSGKLKDDVYNAMFELMKKQSTSEIKSLKTPKGVKIAGVTCKGTLKEQRIIGIAKSKEEFEIGVDDLLKERNAEILEIISKNLWN